MKQNTELKRKAEKISSLIEAIATACIIVIVATCMAIVIGLISQCGKSAVSILTIETIGELFSAIFLSIVTLIVFIPFTSKWKLEDKIYKHLTDNNQ